MDKKFKEQKISQNPDTDLFVLELTQEEKSKLKSLTFRVVFYISQLRNFMVNAIRKNILTPKFYLMYTQKHPGEFKTLKDMQTNINGMVLEKFIQSNKDDFPFIGTYFRQNAMKILTIRRFKRVFAMDYLQKSILIPMAYFKATPALRNSICEFFYFYNTLADFFYIYQPIYISKSYEIYKQQRDGNGSKIHRFQPNLKKRDFNNIVKINAREPSHQELKIMKKAINKSKLNTGLGNILMNVFDKNLENSNVSDREKKEAMEKNKIIRENLKKREVQNYQEEMQLKEHLQAKEIELENLDKEENVKLLELEALEKTPDQEDPIDVELNGKKEPVVNFDDNVLTEQEKDIKKEELMGELEEDEEHELRDKLELNEELIEIEHRLGNTPNPELQKQTEELEDQVLRQEGSLEDLEKFKEEEQDALDNEDPLDENTSQVLKSQGEGQEIIEPTPMDEDKINEKNNSFEEGREHAPKDNSMDLMRIV